MDYSPWFEGKIWPFWKQTKESRISETEEATPTQIGLHAFQITLYLHEFFELIFWPPLTSILKSALRCLRVSRSKPNHIDSVDFSHVISDAWLGSFWQFWLFIIFIAVIFVLLYNYLLLPPLILTLSCSILILPNPTLSLFYLVLLFSAPLLKIMLMDYNPWSEREIWPNFKRSKISKTRKATPIKFGLHAFQITLYLH